jgi:hypothetical protein
MAMLEHLPGFRLCRACNASALLMRDLLMTLFAFPCRRRRIRGSGGVGMDGQAGRVVRWLGLV